MATFTYESLKNKLVSPTVKGNLELLDDGAIIKIAADDDLQLTHSGSAGDITCGTGTLDINTARLDIKDEAGSETMASFISDGAVTLNHDNSARIATTSAGASVTGTLSVSGTSAFTGAVTGTNGFVSSNTSYLSSEIDQSSGNFTIDCAGDIVLDADGGDVLLRDNGINFGGFTSNGNLIIKSGSSPTTAATFSGANVTFSGTVSTSSNLSVTGTITASSNITSSGTVTGAEVTATSDVALKENITTISDALATVDKLRGVDFTWKDGGKNGTGLIAQEVESVVPEAVLDVTTNDETTKTIAYGNLTGVLVEAIKDLKKKVEALEAK
jgi:hypothetical protein